MNLTRYNEAERTYREYAQTDKIKPELLYAWILAEIHFAEEYNLNLGTTLGDVPGTPEVITLWHVMAMGYRDFRYAIRGTFAAKNINRRISI